MYRQGWDVLRAIKVEIYADDCAIHWPDIDEDISVAGLLGLPD